MNKKILSISVLIFWLCLSQNAFWESDICGSQTGDALYQCRVKNVCDIYKSPKPVYNSEDYESPDSVSPEWHGVKTPTLELDAAKKLYRENMGNIYKCAIIQIQINSLKNLEKFIKQEASGRLSDTIGWQLKIRTNRLEISSSTIGCTLADKESIQNKLNILKETSYQACKHVSYLEWLKTYYDKTKNTFSEEEQRKIYGNNFSFKVTPEEVSSDINRRKNAVAEEISHTYQVFPIAYQAYSEYENNFPIHLLLEVIRADFMLLREWLRDNLMPIAQLGLKIINAMSE